MLLFCLSASCLLLGSSAAFHNQEVCYGGNYILPFEYRPTFFRGKLSFTPSVGGPRRVVMEKGQAKDPRFEVRAGSVRLRDLRESDDGTFSVSLGDIYHNVIRLKVLECAFTSTKYYGNFLSFDVPKLTEYLEFTPTGAPEVTRVLWNGSDPNAYKGGGGQKKYNAWRIEKVNPSHDGFYNFRAKDNTLLDRQKLTVEGKTQYQDIKKNEHLYIIAPDIDSAWTLTYSRWDSEEEILISNGYQLAIGYDDPTNMEGRMSVTGDGFELSPVETTDAGIYRFKDSQGNLVETLNVSVEFEETPTYIYVAIIGGAIAGGILLCCCVKRRCCKKSSSKRDSAAPAVSNQDQLEPAAPRYSAAPAGPGYSSTPACPRYSAAPACPRYSAAPAGPGNSSTPAGPGYSAAPAQDYSHRPAVPQQPGTSALGPSTNIPVNVHMNPLQSEVAGPEEPGTSTGFSLGPVFLSSEPGPTFDLKGVRFGSGPPLDSDSNLCNVYKSDKLDFKSLSGSR